MKRLLILFLICFSTMTWANSKCATATTSIVDTCVAETEPEYEQGMGVAFVIGGVMGVNAMMNKCVNPKLKNKGYKTVTFSDRELIDMVSTRNNDDPFGGDFTIRDFMNKIISNVCTSKSEGST